MRRWTPALVALGAIAAVTLGGCQPAKGEDAAFNAKVKAYLMAHPEVLREALQALQTKEQADQAKEQAAAEAKAKAAIPALRNALERDPRDFVANPNGRVTVTEFYDYRCPHCINIASKVLDLIHQRPDIRFVFKEMPIFGATSEHAARAALAAKAQGKDSLAVYEAFMKAAPLTDEAIDRIATAHGIDIAAMTSPEAIARGNGQLTETNALAGRLAINYTPGFVVGNEIVAGEDMDGLMAAIAKATPKP